MLTLLLVILALIFFNKSATKVNPSKVGTAGSPPLSNKFQPTGQIPQTGGLKALPPFWQTSNAATPAVPTTSLGFGFKTPVAPIAHNNIVINGPLNTTQPIKLPISGAFIADNNVEQIAYENATAYGAGSIAIPIAVPNRILGDAGLPQRTAL